MLTGYIFIGSTNETMYETFGIIKSLLQQIFCVFHVTMA